MSNLATVAREAIPAFAMPEGELIEALGSSVYPGAKVASIKLAINYCKASGLDPFTKPVHIVPMRVKKPGTNDYEWRDVIMPGVDLYRVRAARTGQHAGTSEPEFGPTKTLAIGEFSLEHPEWCKVTVKRRLPSGEIVEFTAVEYWVENYATKKDSSAPNDMWKRRVRGQIAKCAEAQALRRAFPEVGAQPTAEEMEGKEIGDLGDGITIEEVGKPAAPMPRSKSEAKRQAEDVEARPAVGAAPAAEKIDPATGEVTRTEAPADDPAVGEGEKVYLRNKAKAANLDLAAICASLGIADDLAGLTKSQFAKLKANLAK